jgi:nitrogen fixation protein
LDLIIGASLIELANGWRLAELQAADELCL